MTETKIKILEAAEVEFADNGFNGASIRNITQRAGVNIASINYHFGSKESLFREMFHFRFDPINEVRLSRLREEQELRGGAPVPLELVIGILVAPVFELLLNEADQPPPRFVMAIARCLSEPLELFTRLGREVFQEVYEEFFAAIRDALPQADAEQVGLQLNFAISSMVGMLTHFSRIEQLVGDALFRRQKDEILQQFITFIASGISGCVAAGCRYENR